jgi:hypothetical protein
MTINGHFWIENEQGEVIHDPSFPDYKMICMIRKCDIKKPHYRKASAERQREMMGEHIIPFMIKYKKMMKESAPPTGWFEPISHNCSTNCIKYKLQGFDGKIVYGDMGWETADGSVWWEFEDACDDAVWNAKSKEHNDAFFETSTRDQRRAVAKAEKKKAKKMRQRQASVAVPVENPGLMATIMKAMTALSAN